MPATALARRVDAGSTATACVSMLMLHIVYAAIGGRNNVGRNVTWPYARQCTASAHIACHSVDNSTSFVRFCSVSRNS